MMKTQERCKTEKRPSLNSQAVDAKVFEHKGERLVMEFGQALHRYGTPAHRIEFILERLSSKLWLQGQYFAVPIAIIASFGQLGAQRAGLVKLEPGGVDLDKLVWLSPDNRAGLSKGRFFHFFPTKQDLLDALCARISDESSAHASRALQRVDLDPVKRLDLFLQQSRAWRSERTKAIGAPWWERTLDENAALMNKVRELSLEHLAPAMARVFVEAIKKGVMRVQDAQVTGRLIVEWLTATVEGTIRLFAAKRDANAIDNGLRQANSKLEAFERLLGIKEGSLRRVDRRVVSRLAANVPKTEGPKSTDPSKAKKKSD